MSLPVDEPLYLARLSAVMSDKFVQSIFRRYNRALPLPVRGWLDSMADPTDVGRLHAFESLLDFAKVLCKLYLCDVQFYGLPYAERNGLTHFTAYRTARRALLDRLTESMPGIRAIFTAAPYFKLGNFRTVVLTPDVVDTLLPSILAAAPALARVQAVPKPVSTAVLMADADWNASAMEAMDMCDTVAASAQSKVVPGRYVTPFGIVSTPPVTSHKRVRATRHRDLLCIQPSLLDYSL